ncbi:hypothetical protein RS030_4655 [Cryptosporidium xiaoi]|uniref:Uncharacterized protein n=1 Tax=Cryptosporidium xiaoi TaxID=659607 RepID=A0AAV9XVD3_9CRYT
MKTYESILSIDENSKVNKTNLSGVVGNILALDTRSENYHPLNKKFNDGFILITNLVESGDFQNISNTTNINEFRTKINDKTRMCVSQELNAIMNKNTIMKLISDFDQFLLINQTDDLTVIEDNLLILLSNYKYLILEKKLIPFEIEFVRKLIYLLMLNRVNLNERLIFFVKDNKCTDPHKKLLYIVLTPRKHESINHDDSVFSVSIVYTPGADKTGFEDSTEKKKVFIKEYTTLEELNSLLNEKRYGITSRYDILLNRYEDKGETKPLSNGGIYKEIDFFEEYTYNGCINISPGTFSTLLVRWCLNVNEQLLPTIKRPNIENIEGALFAFKVDLGNIDFLPIKALAEGISSLERFVYYSIENESTDSFESTLDDGICSSANVSDLTRKLSKLWWCSLLNNTDDYSDKNKESQSTQNVDNTGIRYELDFTDYIWDYVKDIHNIKQIKKTIENILAEINVSLDQSLYESKFVPQIRDENKTLLAELARISVEIHKYKVYSNTNYIHGKEQNSYIKDRKSRWDSIIKKHFENHGTLKNVIVQIGFEHIITDIKTIIRNHEPLINENHFNWHFNELYLKYNNLIEGNDTNQLNQVKIELLNRIKMLLPVCYISKFLSKNRFTWDVSKKLIHSSIKYYSSLDNFNSPAIFVLPIYDKSLIIQCIDELIPNQIEIYSLENHENSISLSKVGYRESPTISQQRFAR